MRNKKVFWILIILAVVAILIIGILIYLLTQQKKVTLDSNTLLANNINRVTYKQISDSELLTKYLASYRTNVIENVNKAYQQLNKEYREIRFPTIQDFQAYLKEKSTFYDSTKKNNLTIDTYEEYTEYAFKDEYNNCYIIREYAINDFDIMLDHYTLRGEQAKLRYQKKDAKNKGIENIESFIQMINNYDYQTSYSILNKEFKSKYFPTLDSYKSYVQTHFGDIITYSMIQGRIESTVQIYTMQISSVIGEEPLEQQIQIFIQLTDGMDYEVSFEIKA